MKRAIGNLGDDDMKMENVPLRGEEGRCCRSSLGERIRMDQTRQRISGRSLMGSRGGGCVSWWKSSFLKNSAFQTQPVDVRAPSASTFPRLMATKNGSIREVKEILLVKGKEPDVEAKTLHVQSAQIPPRSGLPVTGMAVPTPGPV